MEGGGCSNAPCSPGDCSPGGGHSEVLFCPIRAKDRKASSEPRDLSVPASASPQLRGSGTTLAGEKLGSPWGFSPRHPHSPIYRQQLLSGLRGLWPQRDGRRSRCRGKGRQPWPGAALPRYRSSHVPHTDPTLKPAPSIPWWPKAPWPPVTASPGSTPLRASFFSCPRVPLSQDPFLRHMDPVANVHLPPLCRDRVLGAEGMQGPHKRVIRFK